MHFRVSADSFLLANFFKIPAHPEKILEIGTGTGIISLLLSQSPHLTITAVEIDPLMATIAKQNIAINRNTSITLLCEDIMRTTLPGDCFHAIVVNPPYFNVHPNPQQQKKNPLIAKAKSELTLTMENLFLSALKLLKSRGRLTMIYRADALSQLISTATQYHFSLSRLQTIHTTKEKKAKWILLEFVKGSSPPLEISSSKLFKPDIQLIRLKDFESLDQAIQI